MVGCKENRQTSINTLPPLLSNCAQIKEFVGKGASWFKDKITATNLRPDLVFWPSSLRTVYIIELTVPWKDTVEDTYELKNPEAGSLCRVTIRVKSKKTVRVCSITTVIALTLLDGPFLSYKCKALFLPLRSLPSSLILHTSPLHFTQGSFKWCHRRNKQEMKEE
ncbi:Pyridoxine/pyridoxamine 5'-phosphate oxidase [Labeo rohita]|uniref:Pyridoxine/pyridoxamine 5'-phosphate oxidase n=1 Tax=Labeo rohita TaxID=84645 RepID=A0ABQ8LUZ7_LABRO|nr:Pyridoxine/pyridoxamine 5'-phosphate oxidase [Labeo rohita]